MTTRGAVIVTGATGLLGTTLVGELLEDFDQVVAVGRNRERLDRLAATTSRPEGCLTASVDLLAPDGVSALLQQLRAHDLAVSAVVHAARSRSNLTLSGTEPTREQWTSEYEMAVWLPTRLVFELVKHYPLRSVVLVGSQYGVVAPPTHLYDGMDVPPSPPHYNVAKAAQRHLAKIMAVQLAASGVRVNTVNAGGISGSPDSEFEARYAKFVPAGRMVSATEISAAVRFLAGGSASGVTGEDMNVDGGWTAW